VLRALGRSAWCPRAPLWVSLLGREEERWLLVAVSSSDTLLVAVSVGSAGGGLLEAVSSRGTGAWLLLALTDSLQQAPLPPGPHEGGKGQWSSGASGMCTSDKSSSPWVEPVSHCRGLLRPGPRPQAVLCSPMGPASSSRSVRHPFFPLPCGHALSRNVDSGVVANVRVVDATSLRAFSLGATSSWSPAGDTGELANRRKE
jgi:hypothetical protein